MNRLILALALILLSWTSAFADPPMDLPVPEDAVPVNPWVEHPATGRTKVAPVRHGVVHMRDVAPAPPPGGVTLDHQQGDGPVTGRRSFEGIDLVSGEIFQPRRPMTELPPPDRPEILDPTAPGVKAAGDFVASFEGINQAQAGFIPPDTVLAVGPSHVLEAVNSGFTIYSKAGSVIQSFRLLNTFFAPALPTGWDESLFDPRVLFDTFHSKFIFLALSIDRDIQESYVFVAISVTSNPTGSWFFYRYRANEAALAGQWLDFASLGADLWGLYFTGNYFNWADNFQQSSIWVIGPDVFSGGSGAGWRYLDLRWPNGSDARDIQVAHPHSQSFSETFFVNTQRNGDNDILLWELTGDRASSPNLVRTSIGMRSYDPIGENNVEQPGIALGIDGNDARVTNAVYSQRRVYATLPSAPTNNSAGWVTVRLNVDTTTKEWDTLLWGGDGYFYFFPALTISGGTSTCARIGVMGSWTHQQTQFASGLFKIYQSCNSTVGPFLSFINGLDSYDNVAPGTTRNRWGDYSGAAFDWENGYLWGAVEYADVSVPGNRPGRWRTRITARKFDPDLKAEFTFFCNGLSCFFFDSSVEGRYPITSYSWTFGDGSSSGSENPTHTYSFAGTYTVTLKVTDSSGAMSSRSQPVTADEGCPGCPECIVCPE